MDGFVRDDLDRRPSVIALNLGDVSEENLGDVVARRGKRKAISAESFVPDANFRAPKFQHSDIEIQGLRRATANNMLFKTLTEQQKNALFKAMEKIRVGKGEVMISEGDSGDYFYVVMQGNFEVFKTETGSIPVYSYTGGGSFGELALMYNCPRAATVVATADSTVFRLDRHTFRQVIVQTDGAGQHINRLRNKFVKRTQSICQSQGDITEARDIYRRQQRPPATANFERLYRTPTENFENRFTRRSNSSPRVRLSRKAHHASLQDKEIRKMGLMKISGDGRTRFAHQFNIQRVPSPVAMKQYSRGMSLREAPLRIVSHSVLGNGTQKQNPDHTHRGRIRNASGGFYSA